MSIIFFISIIICFYHFFQHRSCCCCCICNRNRFRTSQSRNKFFSENLQITLIHFFSMNALSLLLTVKQSSLPSNLDDMFILRQHFSCRKINFIPFFTAQNNIGCFTYILNSFQICTSYNCLDSCRMTHNPCNCDCILCYPIFLCQTI